MANPLDHPYSTTAPTNPLDRATPNPLDRATTPVPSLGGRLSNLAQGDVGGAMGDINVNTSPLGIAANTIFGLPKAAFDVGTDIFHGIMRSAAAIPLTLSAATNARTGTSAPTTLNAPDASASPLEQDAYKFLFGDQPIHDLSTQIAQNELNIKNSPLAQTLGLDKAALPLAFGGTLTDEALNFLPAGGDKNLAKYLLNETNPESIAKFLIHSNVPEDVAQTFAPHFAGATTKAQVDEGLTLMKSAIGNSRLAEREAANAPAVTAADEGAAAAEHPVPAESVAPPVDGTAPKLGELAPADEPKPTLTEPAPLRAAATEISPVSAQMSDLGARMAAEDAKPAEEISSQVLRGAAADWEKTYAPKMQALFDEGTKAQKAFEGASAADKPLYKAQLDGIIAKQDAIEQEFVGNWRQQAGLPRDIPTDRGLDARPILDEMTHQPRESSGGPGPQKYGDLAAAQKLGDLLQKTSQRPQGLDAFLHDASRVLDMDSGKEAQLKSLYFRTLATRSKRTPAELAKAAEDFTARGLRMRAIGEIAQGRYSSPASILRELPANDQASLRIIVGDMARTVKQKVNLLDYFTTPEFVLEKMGMGREAKMLQTAKDGYQKQLPKEIERITKWKAAAEAAAPNDKPGDVSRRIFKYLNGDRDTPTLPAPQMAIATEIRTYLREWANKLGLPMDKQISHYITHIFEPDLIQKEFDPDLARLISDKIPGSVYDPFLERRLGTMGYKEDAWAALDAYVKRASRKVNFDPALKEVKMAAEKLDVTSEKYIKRMTDRINLRPTELDELTDNLLKSTPRIGYKFGQRPTTRLLSTLRQWYYRGTLGLNVGSALRNLTQGANTFAKLGTRYTTQGYFKVFSKMFSPGGLQELHDVGVLGDSFITDRKLSVYKQTLQKLDSGLFAMFETAEKINRGAAYFGAKARAIDKGLSQADAIEYAKRIVRETQFSFGSVDTPLVISQGGELGRSALQMQGFTLKQIEFLSRMASNREFAGLARYTIGSLAMLATIGKLFGMKPSDLVPLAGGYGGSPLGNLISGTYGKLTAQTSQQQKDANSKLSSSLVGLIPAGVQLRKSLQGAQVLSQGKDTTPTGKTRYNVPRDMGTALRAILFGKNTLPQAQQYYNALDAHAKRTSNPL